MIHVSMGWSQHVALYFSNRGLKCLYRQHNSRHYTLNSYQYVVGHHNVYCVPSQYDCEHGEHYMLRYWKTRYREPSPSLAHPSRAWGQYLFPTIPHASRRSNTHLSDLIQYNTGIICIAQGLRKKLDELKTITTVWRRPLTDHLLIVFIRNIVYH